MRSRRSEEGGIGKVVEISVLGIATRLLRATREYLFPMQSSRVNSLNHCRLLRRQCILQGKSNTTGEQPIVLAL